MGSGVVTGEEAAMTLIRMWRSVGYLALFSVASCGDSGGATSTGGMGGVLPTHDRFFLRNGEVHA